MKKGLKWIGIFSGSLAGLLIITIGILYVRGNFLIQKTYNISVDPITIPVDAASIEKGKHLTSVLCMECHGANFSGLKSWFRSDALGSIDSANLTSGQGGIGIEYQSVEDYMRAIRHGVDPEGKPIYMPAVLALNHLSDEDLGAIIAYLKLLPPVDQITQGHQQLSSLAVILIGAGRFTMPAELVDHNNQHPAAPPAGVNPEYGQYLVEISHCKECHGVDLSGGRHPDPSLTMIGPNLTPGGDLASWTEQDFLNALRTGVTPSGRYLSPLMPWPYIGQMTDGELQAIWLYLQSLPARSSDY